MNSDSNPNPAPEQSPDAPGPAPGPGPAVERLFPFVLRTRTLLVGRDTLRRSKSRLHFILITRELSENSREQLLRDFAHYPVVQHYSEADLERFFGVRGAKVVGFAKSSLAQSIYRELKAYRINTPVAPTRKIPQPAESKPAPPTKSGAAVSSGSD